MIYRCKSNATFLKFQTKIKENFRVFLPKKGGIFQKNHFFLKIFGEKFWYYENSLYICNVKINLMVNIKLQTS